MAQEKPQVTSVLATDVGSTTTKAILIELRGDEYRLICRGEMPTTVEAPWEDVMIGVRKAIRRVEEITQRPILSQQGKLVRPLQPAGDGKPASGVDFYVSTSSAGGGLQMMVAGLVSSISASSAHRAALGAGAVVLDVIAVDDGRSTSEQITRITELRPDIILMSGGVDGGSVTYIAAIAETIVQANPQPRFGATYKLPLVYAGNHDAQDMVSGIAGVELDVHLVDNLRPRHDLENLGPARETIHDLFMNHVMAQAPGYGQLMKWVDGTIMPTPGAVGSIIQLMAQKYKANIIGVDIGGATTDVFSDFGGTFTRTVSANLGMSYSVCNVLEEASFQNIRRWLPFEVDEEGLCDWIANKMVRPTTIPQTMDKLILEQAIAREALRLSFEHHKSLARKVEAEEISAGWRTQRKLFKASGEEIIDLLKLDMLVGSGGVLSHAPRRAQAALMLMDSFQPEGVTQLAVDSIFMMPHLGVLATTYPEISAEVFDKDCLVRLGTCIAPVGPKIRDGQPVLDYRLIMPSGRIEQGKVGYGQLVRIDLPVGARANVTLRPAAAFDLGLGKGHTVEAEVEGGLVGVIFDCRGRPLALPAADTERVAKLIEWIETMGVYDAECVKRYAAERPFADDKGKPGEKGGRRGGLFGRVRR
ncbi:MAG: glutamate mutase L [Bacillota bacterium]|nr:glutamate mutase L [Bacillota bacterium]